MSTFPQLSCSNFKLKLCKKPCSSQICPKNKFEEDWSELEARNCFQRQSWTNFMRQTLVFMRNSAIRENFKTFQQFSASIKKNLGLEGRLGTRLYFYQVLRFFWSFLIGLFLDSDFIITYHIPLVSVQTGYCINNLLIMDVRQLNKIMKPHCFYT